MSETNATLVGKFESECRRYEAGSRTSRDAERLCNARDALTAALDTGESGEVD